MFISFELLLRTMYNPMKEEKKKKKEKITDITSLMSLDVNSEIEVLLIKHALCYHFLTK